MLPLDWWAFRRTERTEYTAVAGFRAKQDLAVLAFLEELTGVHRQCLEQRRVTLRQHDSELIEKSPRDDGLDLPLDSGAP